MERPLTSGLLFCLFSIAVSAQTNTFSPSTIPGKRNVLKHSLPNSRRISASTKAITSTTQTVSAYQGSSDNNNVYFGYGALANTAPNMLNTAVGYNTLYANTSGDVNAAFGGNALSSNTTGYWNVALGAGSMQSNTTGFQSTAVGESSLWSNTTGQQNVAIGQEALAGNIDGNWNTAIGTRAIWSTHNSTGAGDDTYGYGHGTDNTAIGFEAMRSITSAQENIAMGVHSLVNDSTGWYNVAIGNNALDGIGYTHKNIAIGFQAGMGNVPGHLYNSVAIGYNARALSSYQIVLGDNAVTQIGGAVNWSVYADNRISKNVQQNVPGLAFINKLQPITYNYDLDAADKITGNPNPQNETSAKSVKEQVSYTGFMAQDVDNAGKSISYNFSGIVAPQNAQDLYSLRYAEFVGPLVKAVQELSNKNDSLQSQINELKQLMQQVLAKQSDSLSKSTSLSPAFVEQNTPNPFRYTTNISYSILTSFSSAYISLSDNTGKEIKTIPIYSNKGAVNIDGGMLMSGLYYYTLYVDGKLKDSRKMVIAR